MASDIFQSAILGYNTGRAAVQQDLDNERQARLDARALESHNADMKVKALNTQLLQGQVDQHKELADQRYFFGALDEINAANKADKMTPDPVGNDTLPAQQNAIVNAQQAGQQMFTPAPAPGAPAPLPLSKEDLVNAQNQQMADKEAADSKFNQTVDRYQKDSRFQEIIGKYPWAKDLLAKSDERTETFNQFGDVLAGLVNNPEYSAQFIRSVGDHQELVGPPALQLFGIVKKQRQLNGVDFPDKVDPASVKFVSPSGGQSWALQFDYMNDQGQRVPGVATVNMTKRGEPGSENDPVVAKSIPDLLNETSKKHEINLTLSRLKARMLAGDAHATALMDKMDTEDIERGKNEERFAQGWADVKSDPEIQAMMKSSSPYGAMIKSMISFGEKTKSDPSTFKTQYATMQSEMAKRNLDEKDAAVTAKMYATGLANSGTRGSGVAKRTALAMKSIPEDQRSSKAGLATHALIEKTIQADEQAFIEMQKVHAARAAGLAGASTKSGEYDKDSINSINKLITTAKNLRSGKITTVDDITGIPTTKTVEPDEAGAAALERQAADQIIQWGKSGKVNPAIIASMANSLGPEGKAVVIAGMSGVQPAQQPRAITSAPNPVANPANFGGNFSGALMGRK